MHKIGQSMCVECGRQRPFICSVHWNSGVLCPPPCSLAWYPPSHPIQVVGLAVQQSVSLTVCQISRHTVCIVYWPKFSCHFTLKLSLPAWPILCLAYSNPWSFVQENTVTLIYDICECLVFFYYIYIFTASNPVQVAPKQILRHCRLARVSGRHHSVRSWSLDQQSHGEYTASCIHSCILCVLSDEVLRPGNFPTAGLSNKIHKL